MGEVVRAGGRQLRATIAWTGPCWLEITSAPTSHAWNVRVGPGSAIGERDGTATWSGGPPALAAVLPEKQLTDSRTTTWRWGAPLSTSVSFLGGVMNRLTRPTIGAVGCVSGPVVPAGGFAVTYR